METLNAVDFILWAIVGSAEILFIACIAVVGITYMEHLIGNHNGGESDFNKLVAWVKNKLFIVDCKN